MATLTPLQIYTLWKCKTRGVVTAADIGFIHNMGRNDAYWHYAILCSNAQSSLLSWGKVTKTGLYYHFSEAEWTEMTSFLQETYPNFAREGAQNAKHDSDSAKDGERIQFLDTKGGDR